jgi:hypothetical protein
LDKIGAIETKKNKKKKKPNRKEKAFRGYQLAAA